MERNYSQFSSEQLVNKRQTLKNRLESAQEVLGNIATVDFVENRRLQKPNSNPQWLEKFNLKGLTGDAYFNKLGKDIIPIQLRLKRKSIPGFQADLRQVNREAYIRTSTEILNLIMEDPNFSVDLAMIFLSKITPQKALEDLTHTVDILDEREKLKTLDPFGAEVLEKMNIFGNFKQELQDWFGNSAPKNSTQAVEKRKETAVIPEEELDSLANLIIKLVPEDTVNSWFGNKTLTPNQYQEQAINFAQTALQVKAEGGPSFNPMEIVNTPDTKRLEAAQSAIRRTLSQLIIEHPQKQLGELKFRWGNKMRELIAWLGGGGRKSINEGTKELVTKAINSLPEVEHALVLEISSLELLKNLGYIDLEECDEKVFATYLRDVAFIPNSLQDQRDDDFEFLLVTAAERSDAGALDMGLLIDLLCEPPYEGLIIEKMRESAKAGGFEHLLVEIFVSHPATVKIAREIEGFTPEDPINDGDKKEEEDEELPGYRLTYVWGKEHNRRK